MFGRSKKAVFNGIVERVWKKLKGWKASTLSRAGKEILIKSVVQSIPVYAMSCFQLPSSTCAEIERLLCRFWWGSGIEKRKAHWMSWQRLCLPKSRGGMGFRDFRTFNLALLARQGWRLLQHPTSLISRLIKARYYPVSSFCEASLGHSPNFTWRGILAGREVLDKGLMWSVGNGRNIRVWIDKWIPMPVFFRPFRNPTSASQDMLVSSLINWETRCWRQDEVYDLFDPVDADLILTIPLIDNLIEDEVIWFPTKDERFSVKSAYIMLRAYLDDDDYGSSSSSTSSLALFWKHLWRFDTIPRVRDFLWRACRDILPCRVSLQRRGIEIDVRCDLCGGVETAIHALFECPLAKNIWSLHLTVTSIGYTATSCFDWVEKVMKELCPVEQQCWAALVYSIWSARNLRIFEGKQHEPAEISSDVMILLEGHLRAKTTLGNPHGCLTSPCRWSGPNTEFVKINCDVAVTYQSSGLGVIARDHVGDVTFYAARKGPGRVDATLVESEAILWALQLEKEKGLSRIVVESDCQAIIQRLRRKDFPLGSMGVVLHRIRTLEEDFESCKWSFVRREGNKAAHYLVSLRPNHVLVCFNSVCFNSCLLSIIENDVLGLTE